MIPERPRTVIADARAEGRALAAFNVSNMETTQGVIAAAEEAGTPVILQISPGAITYAGYHAIVAIARSAAERSSVPTLLHLDHCQDPERVRAAIDDGFSSVMFDGSTLPLDENISLTTDLVRAAHARGVAFEAELGIIGGSESMTIEEARRGITSPADARSFVSATDVDILAPALGSLHRMPDDSVSLDVALIGFLADAAQRPLALHGGSGVDRRQLRAAISAGVGKVNISSRVGRSFARGIRDTWAADPDALDLRRYLGAGREDVRRMAAEYLELCGAPGSPPQGTANAWSDRLTEPE